MLYLVIVCLFLILCPFYIFPSGLPQPADIILAIGGAIFISDRKNWGIVKVPIFKHILRLFFLITIINISYWFIYYAFMGIGNRMFFIPTYYIFNLFFMFLMVSLQISKASEKNINLIALTIIVSLAVQFILAILGIQGGNKDPQFSSRATNFFNNPNQLGYFVLAMTSLFFVLESKYKKNIFILIFTILISCYLTLFSGSRAALAGVILLSIYIFYKEGFKLNIKSLFFLGIFLLAIPFLLQTEFAQKRLTSINARNERSSTSNVSELQVRGYDRILLNPEYLFMGAGEGKNDRFESYHQLEIHSGFGTMLFSYGFLGFTLFCFIIYYIIKQNPLYSIMILLPILVYNITHNGLRESLLWGLFVSLYLANAKTQFKNRLK